MILPKTITLNAFTGDGVTVSGNVAEHGNRWGGVGDELAKQAPLAPGGAAGPADWAHVDIGWGVVMADREDLSAREKADGVDAPDPIRALIAARGNAPVLRYRKDLGERKLARYFADGTRQDPEIGLTPFGTGKGRLPLYLLIVGSPTEIPWRLQYSLNRRHHVGRLDLPGPALSNYVNALLSDWAGIDCDPTKSVVWSVNYDSITQKMEITIAERISRAMGTDNELSISRIEGDAATKAALVAALRGASPAVVVTSSHGKTGPLNDADAMRRTLGLPVDANRETLDTEDLLGAWEPSGAVWYAQACCSAGSGDGTSYDGLLDAGSVAHEVVGAVAELGAGVAPLPTKLLGATKPLRAFLGHVEPTFDWTLLVSDTGQYLTDPLVDAIYPNIYRRCPLGLALDAHYRGVGELYGKLENARTGINNLVPGAREDATYFRLTATDRQSLVILGDPAVVIPPLPSQTADPGTGRCEVKM